MTTVTTALLTCALAQPQIPGPDPLGFPLPPWILQALAWLTLTLHFLAMNFTVGGLILFLWARWRKIPDHEGITRFLGSSFPLGVSYIITLGIPPLLFVQVLYGQLFYASSVIVGTFWIQVIPVMLAAYAIFYYHKFMRDARPRGQTALVVTGAVLLLYVGFIYVNNLTLSMSPEKFAGLYADHPGGGVLLHGEPTIVPRFLLFLSGSFAVTGLALMWRGHVMRRWGLAEAADISERTGLRTVLLSPAVWLVAALGLLATRGNEIKALWQEVGATPVLFAVGLIGLIGLVLFAYRARGAAGPGALISASLGITLAIASQVIFRDLTRIWALEGTFDLAAIPVNLQWGMFAIFVVTLAAGAVFLVVWGIRVVPAIAEKARERLTAIPDRLEEI